MGIKRKIYLGFISIGSLLLLSGVISTLELVRFNRSTHMLLERNQMSVELSKKMLDAVQEQNTALLMNVTDSVHFRYDSVLMANKMLFDSAYVAALEYFTDSPQLALLKQANEEYSLVISDISDTTSISWFSRVYKTSYFTLTNAIKDFMVDTQRQIIQYTADLESNAYRATMVGIIALAAGLLLIIIFYYMINRFVVAPILLMNRSLDRHLKLRIPFDVQVRSKDEIMEFRDSIKQVIEKAKK